MKRVYKKRRLTYLVMIALVMALFTGCGENKEAAAGINYVELLADGTIDGEDASNKDFEYRKTESGYIEIRKYLGDDTKVKIPSKLKGLPVLSILDTTFEDCDFVEEIIFPDHLLNVRSGKKYENYFSNTDWYKNLPDGLYYAGNVLLGYKGEMPYGYEVVIAEGTISVAERAFWNVYIDNVNIGSIKFPETLRLLNYEAFQGCDLVTEVTLPGSLEKFDRAFPGAKKLQKVILEEGIKEISEQAFIACESLEEVHFPESLEVIEYYAFANCYSLDEVQLNKGLLKIGEAAFGGTAIKEIQLHEGLEGVDNYAFANCFNLMSVDVPSSLTSMGYSAFGVAVNGNEVSVIDGFTMYVEEGSVAQRAAEDKGIQYVLKEQKK